MAVSAPPKRLKHYWLVRARTTRQYGTSAGKVLAEGCFLDSECHDWPSIVRSTVAGVEQCGQGPLWGALKPSSESTTGGAPVVECHCVQSAVLRF